MPLARIITSIPDRAKELAERLRRSGYRVETVLPNEVEPGHADLELKLNSENAVQAVKEIAARVVPNGPDVYIASGALRSSPLLNADAGNALPAVPTIADTMNGVAAGLQNKRDLLAKALREQRMLLQQERKAERQRMRAASRSPLIASSGESSAPIELHWQAAQEPRPERTVISPGLMSDSEISEPLQPEAAVSLPLPEERAEEVVQPVELVENAPEMVSNPRTGPAQDEYTFEPMQHAEPAVPVLASEAGMRSEPRVDAPRPRGRVRVVVPGGRKLSRRAREWRAAVLISCLFAGMLMLGWAVVTRGPVSPLPSSFSTQSTTIEESVPFGAATLKPMASAALSPHTHHSSVRPTPQTVEPAPSRPKPQVKTPSTASTSLKAKPKRRVSRASAEQDVADDEVIYHRPAANTQPADNEKASLKKFSD